MSASVQKPSEQSTLGELVTHIQQTHHTFTKKAITRIDDLLNLGSQEKTNFETTANIQRCFQKLKSEVLQHMMKEEQILFPYIVALEKNPEQPPSSCFGSVANPIYVMGMDHQEVKGLLGQLREFTSNYQPNPEHSPSVTALYGALAEIDRDLEEHIHWEDDVLFPRAIQLEQETTV